MNRSTDDAAAIGQSSSSNSGHMGDPLDPQNHHTNVDIMKDTKTATQGEGDEDYSPMRLRLLGSIWTCVFVAMIVLLVIIFIIILSKKYTEDDDTDTDTDCD